MCLNNIGCTVSVALDTLENNQKMALEVYNVLYNSNNKNFQEEAGKNKAPVVFEDNKEPKTDEDSALFEGYSEEEGTFLKYFQRLLDTQNFGHYVV